MRPGDTLQHHVLVWVRALKHSAHTTVLLYSSGLCGAHLTTYLSQSYRTHHKIS